MLPKKLICMWNPPILRTIRLSSLLLGWEWIMVKTFQKRGWSNVRTGLISYCRAWVATKPQCWVYVGFIIEIKINHWKEYYTEALPVCSPWCSSCIIPDHDGLWEWMSRDVFHNTSRCDVLLSAGNRAHGLYTIGSRTVGILKYWMFMQPTAWQQYQQQLLCSWEQVCFIASQV